MLVFVLVLIVYITLRCPACPAYWQPSAPDFTWLNSVPYLDKVQYHRRGDFDRISDITYLDYATNGLFPDSLLYHYTALLHEGLYGNTHSESPSSEKSSALVDDLRAQILKWLGTDLLKYSVIFTHSGSHALKTFVEAFPFGATSAFLFSASSSADILGLRHLAHRRHAAVRAFEFDAVPPSFAANSTNLLAFPLVDAFDGTVVSDGDIAAIAALNATGGGRVCSLADASHYLAFRRLNLTASPLSAVAFDCRRLFGFPQLGALVVDNALIPLLEKPYFGGGTLVYALPGRAVERLRMRPSERFEDGSLPFLSLVGLESAFAHVAALGQGNVTAHVANVTAALLARMANLTNPDGSRAVRVYGGGAPSIVAFNFVDAQGSPRAYAPYLASALKNNIAISGGCQGTPRTCRRALGVEGEADTASVGALRISPGWATLDADVDRVIGWMRFAIANVTEPAGGK
jgi:molybdenum cofactor sulfurtransferase